MRAQQQQSTLRERTIFRLDMLPLVFVDKYKNRNINDKQPRAVHTPTRNTKARDVTARRTKQQIVPASLLLLLPSSNAAGVRA